MFFFIVSVAVELVGTTPEIKRDREDKDTTFQRKRVSKNFNHSSSHSSCQIKSLSPRSDESFMLVKLRMVLLNLISEPDFKLLAQFLTLAYISASAGRIMDFLPLKIQMMLKGLLRRETRTRAYHSMIFVLVGEEIFVVRTTVILMTWRMRVPATSLASMSFSERRLKRSENNDMSFLILCTVNYY